MRLPSVTLLQLKIANCTPLHHSLLHTPSISGSEDPGWVVVCPLWQPSWPSSEERGPRPGGMQWLRWSLPTRRQLWCQWWRVGCCRSTSVSTCRPLWVWNALSERPWLPHAHEMSSWIWTVNVHRERVRERRKIYWLIGFQCIKFNEKGWYDSH